MDKLRKIREVIKSDEEMNKVGVSFDIHENANRYESAVEAAFRGRREHPIDMDESKLDVLLDTDKYRYYIVPSKYTKMLDDNYHFAKHNISGNYPRFDELKFNTSSGEGIIYTVAFPMERKSILVNLVALHYLETLNYYEVEEFVKDLLDKRKEEKQAVRKRK